MSAPTPVPPRSPRTCTDGAQQALANLVTDHGFTVRTDHLADDIGILDANQRTLWLDRDSSDADLAYFLHECWAFCNIDPIAADHIELDTRRHLCVVRNAS